MLVLVVWGIAVYGLVVLALRRSKRPLATSVVEGLLTATGL